MNNIPPHMWVISVNPLKIIRSKQDCFFIVTIGDPYVSTSKLMRVLQSEDDVRQWVKNNVGTTVSINHIMDTTDYEFLKDAKPN